MLPAVKEPRCAFCPPQLVCGRSKLPAPETFDGRLDKAFWAQAPERFDFHDIEGEVNPKPFKKTSFRMLWDDEALYIGAKLWDDTIWATVKERDAIIFVDNDFEVFLSPDIGTHRYFEIEMNAFGAVWDLMMDKPQRDGAQRIVSWDIAGLRTAVYVEGEVNNPDADNKFWSIEMKIPWQSLRTWAPFRLEPVRLAPETGETWRLNFSRVEYLVNERYEKLNDSKTGKPFPEFNWVWAPTGVIDIHMPEMWGYLQFAQNHDDLFQPDPDEKILWELRKLYYRQRNYGAANGRYASSLSELMQGDTAAIMPEIFTTPSMFEIIYENVRKISE